MHSHEAPCLRISSEFDMSLFAGRGMRAGLTFFETDELTDREKHHLSGLDRLLVPSAWARNVVETTGLTELPTTVVPMGVDGGVFRAVDTAQHEETVFLHVGKWEHRKGQDFLIDGFERAFGPDEPVRLELMCDNPYLGERNEEWRSRCRSSPMADRIRLLPRVVSVVDVARRMQGCDCGVFPARAEGWNLELLEMMACGKPVIATNYSGHTAFVSQDNCRLIDVEALEPAVDERFSPIYGRTKKGRWAHLGDRQMEQLVEHLRAIHRIKQDGGDLRNHKGQETAASLTWARSAASIASALFR